MLRISSDILYTLCTEVIKWNNACFQNSGKLYKAFLHLLTTFGNGIICNEKRNQPKAQTAAIDLNINQAFFPPLVPYGFNRPRASQLGPPTVTCEGGGMA
ncbi:hypothetical protein CHARACLAT_014611 [Characodon lateralis]|uniref:Uncharacterized protein n=1 Tax=Characodon lateralis TaxID=208331 RepID=A0ABU7D9U3_9TELE|nr:hypothetical protein [Characodon lateralis]